MRFRAILVFVMLLSLLTFAKNASAALTVTNVTLTMDRSTFYANDSAATATAVLEYTAGPAKDIGDVQFTWFRPDWSIAQVYVETAKDDANASSTYIVDMVGFWFVNATYVNQTDQFDNVSFEVRSSGSVVIVSDMNLDLNAPFFELGEVVVATSTLIYAGNVSLLEVVSFTWLDPLGSVIQQNDVSPNSTGVAVDSWQSDSEGDPFTVFANYSGDAPASRSVVFQVFPKRVTTWHNFSVFIDETWDIAGSPYGVCGNITVLEGMTLTIEPGVTVRFCEDSSLTVNGTLISDGTLDNIINYTAFGFFPPKGYWQGITVNPTSGDTSSLTYSYVTYASIGLEVFSSSPVVDRNVFENVSFAAVQLENTSISLGFNIFNSVGTAVSVSTSNVDMHFNDIMNVAMGLAMFDSMAALDGDAVFNATLFGIHSFNSSLNATDLNISSFGGSGIRLQSQSHANVAHSVVHDSFYGVDVFESTFMINESSLYLNEYAVRANDAVGDLVNTSVMNSTMFDFTLDGGSMIVALNCTLNDSKVQVLPASELLVQYYLDVQVNDEDSGDPLSNVMIEVLDGGSITYSSRTPSSGRIRWIPVTDRTFDGSDTPTKHTITVQVRKSGFDVPDDGRTIDMSVSHLEVFLASEIPPEIWDTVTDPPNLMILILIITVVVLAVAFIVAKRRRAVDEEEMASSERVPEPSEIELHSGTGYIVAGEKPDLAFDVFSHHLEGGARGLCITRTFPDEVVKTYSLGEIPIIWLSRDAKRANINPTNLGAIILEVQRFLKQNEGKETIVLLDGLEYLIVQNDFSKVIKFAQNLKDTISVSGSRLLIPFNLVALEESKRALLIRDLEVIE